MKPDESLTNLFTDFNKLRVLVIGDLMLDAYTWGKVERISPEAPVPVVHVLRREVRLGGAGNVLLNVQALGAEAVACSVIGTDEPGDAMLAQLTARGLPTGGVVRSSNRITTIKERIIAGSQQVVRLDTETDQHITEAEQTALLERIESLIKTCHVVVFEDYDKGVLSQPLIEAAVALARQYNVPTVVDPKKRNFLHYRSVTLFKPNLKELSEGLKVDFDPKNEAEVAAVVQQLKQTLTADGVLLTRSERGVYIDFRNETHQLPAHFRAITDVSGAGDTVISIAACCVALHQSPERIAALSNLGGGLVCESLGVVPIDKAKLLAEALHFGV